MKRCKFWGGAVLLGLLMACTDEDYKLYDTAQKDSVFFEYIDENEEEAVSVEYAFNFDVATIHTIEIPVKLMGMPVDHDRTISLIAVKDSTDMVEGVHYTVDDAVIPANEVGTVLKVNLLRENDPKLQEKAFTLLLEIVENEDLRAVGQKYFKITYSDIHPTQRPDWWYTYLGLPVYSYEAAQQFFKYFYELAPVANRDVYNEMIKAYGDYFVKAVYLQGPFVIYTNFLLKYVQIPMYNDLKDKFEWQAVPSM